MFGNLHQAVILHVPPLARLALLESLCNVRFTAVQAPHDGGDHMADVDGHFGKDARWVAIRKAETLRHLERPYDAVVLAAAVSDAEIHQALARCVTGGGTLVVFPAIAQYDEGGKPYPAYPH